MKKIECPSCAMEVDASEDKCPVCGYEFPKQPLSLKIAVWIMILLILVWIFF